MNRNKPRLPTKGPNYVIFFVGFQLLLVIPALFYCSNGSTSEMDSYCRSYNEMENLPEYSPIRDVFVRPFLVNFGASEQL